MGVPWHASAEAGGYGPALVRRADPFPEIDGESTAVIRLKRDLACVARDPFVSVLLRGESGTGKERVARAIHHHSPRSAFPFVVVDCAGLTPSLAEDALFGHVRGAFTGAIDERAGPFERAQGGTVLLDEIGDLSLDLQLKLLRAIQSRVVQRLGARSETQFDVRIVAATNVDLESAKSAGRFRADLYHRLNVYEIVVPPLRRRGEADIRALAAVVLDRLSARRNRPAPKMDPAVLERLADYAWPGNVRELENAIERMLVAAAGDSILAVRHLPDRLRRDTAAFQVQASALPSRTAISETLERHSFKCGRAAADLGLSRHQLYRLVKRHGIRAADGDR
jgi:transcriptional regulator with GAF, ATPase, and Fis domain